MATTTNKGYTIPVVGGSTDTWGTLLNGDLALIDSNLGGTVSIDCAGSSDITLNSTQASNYILSLTGILTGNISVKVPQTGSFYEVVNGTSGAYTVTIKTTAGGSTGPVIPQGSRWEVCSDGTNVWPATIADGTQLYGVDSGTASALVVTTRVALASLTDGIACTVKVANVNNASATLNFNGTGAKPIYVGSGGTMAAVGAAAWAAGQDISFRYDTSLDSGSGGWQASTISIPTLGALAYLDTVGTAQIDNSAVTTGKINNNAVTFAKMQAITDGRLLGASGSTAVSEITVGSGLSLAAGTLSASGKVIAVYTGSYTSNTDLTTVIPQDDTVPTGSEGTQIISVSVTTTSATQAVRIEFSGQVAVSGVGASAAIYRDGTCKTAQGLLSGANIYLPFSIVFSEVPGSAATFTYTVRVGPTAGAIRMNGTTSGRWFGGVSAAVMNIEVVEP